MKNRFLLLMGLICAVLLAVSGTTAAAAEDAVEPLLPLPELLEGAEGTMVTIDGEDPMIGPHEKYYTFREDMKTAASYVDPSISVVIGRGRFKDTDYTYARVRIASAAQLRTLLASPLGSENEALGSAMAKRVRAVVALNGDFAAKQVRGTVIRQGEVLRLNSDGEDDVLIVDAQGDLHILEKGTNAQIEAFEGEILHSFTFGPALIVEGEPRYGSVDRAKATAKDAQRVAFCQTGPLEYLLMTSEGPEDKGSNGLKLDEFVELLAHFPEIRSAYNLDGGSSATLVFRKEDNNWRKVNSPHTRKERNIKDIIYFADAWEPAPDPTPTPEPEAAPEEGPENEIPEGGEPAAEEPPEGT